MQPIGVIAASGPADALFFMRKDPMAVTVAALVARYRIEGVLGAGATGLVLAVSSAQLPGVAMALKISIPRGSDATLRWDGTAREAFVAQRLTELFTDIGDDLDVVAPVVKTYDRALVTIASRELLHWLLGAIPDPIGTARVMKFARTSGLATRPTKMAGLMVMERAGTVLTSILEAGPVPEPMLASIVLQTLLVLAMLNETIGFVHGDLHSSNIMVQELAAPIVVRYAVARNVTLHVRTPWLVKLVDFDYSRMATRDVVVAKPDSGYIFQTGSSGDFFPWADTVRMVLNLLGHAHQLPLAELSEPMRRFLGSMIPERLVATSDEWIRHEGEYAVLRGLVETEPRRVDDIRYLANGKAHLVPMPTDPAAHTPRGLLLPVVSYIEHTGAVPEPFHTVIVRPTATERIYDFSAAIGDGGSPVAPAWPLTPPSAVVPSHALDAPPAAAAPMYRWDSDDTFIEDSSMTPSPPEDDLRTNETLVEETPASASVLDSYDPSVFGS
jgi:serine/threonine protein kinase